jgi:biofilm PGA synthesis N-glycosyltransferase PgaC
MINCSIGIMAYNEEANIGRLLDALLRQNLSHCFIKEIFVVASGCTDRTEDIVKDYIRLDERIKLLVQRQREGKASAINLFLSKANADVFVLESGDTIPEVDTMEKLVMPFSDPTIGMTGGGILCPSTLCGRFTTALLLNTPKWVSSSHFETS